MQMNKAESAARGRAQARRRQYPALPTFRTVATFLVKATIISGLLFTAVFFALFLFLPLPEIQVPQATRVYDAKGRLVSSLFVQNRIIVPSSEIPDSLKQAVIAVEDKRFYSHHGIDLESLGRALLRNLKARRVVEGGSTITQQLAKNLFLSDERTLKRKLLEAVYTLKLEMRYTKEEILTMYLNQIYLGHGSYGCEVASRLYFGKSVKELTLSESATLAGIIASPENYSPYHNMDLAIEKRNMVLDLMTQQGYITPRERDEAKAQKIRLAGLPKSQAPYFVDYVISQIKERHPEIASQIYRGGFQIYTTLDLDIQRAAEEAFKRYIPEGTKDARGITQPQGALVAIEPSTGYIKALVGGRDWAETQLNRAYQVRRQPGSAFKIFLYTAVIDLGHQVTETRMCEPVEYQGKTAADTYRPTDFGRRPYHYAPLNVRQAVAISDNVVATRWASEIGPSKIVEYARKMGIKSPLEASIPLALGTSEVTPLEMAVGAATLAAQGVRPEPIAILKVIDARGNVIEENSVKRTQVLDPGTCYIVTSLLRSVLGPGGTGEGLAGFLAGRPAAGKTGTTDDLKEAWFVGYTRELACAVYVGWDNREKSLQGTGGTVAGPIWAKFMAEALKNEPFKDWPLPSNVAWVEVCDESGYLAGPTCFKRHLEVVKKGASLPVCNINHLFEFLFPGKKTSGLEGEGPDAADVPNIMPREAPASPGPSGTIEPNDLLRLPTAPGTSKDSKDKVNANR